VFERAGLISQPAKLLFAQLGASGGKLLFKLPVALELGVQLCSQAGCKPRHFFAILFCLGEVFCLGGVGLNGV